MNIEDEIVVKAKELEDLLNQAPALISASIDSIDIRSVGGDVGKRIFAIRIESTSIRRLYP